MSADKHKKRDRAFALLRSSRRAWWGTYSGKPMRRQFSGRPTKEMRWLIDRGFAVIQRLPGFGRVRGKGNVFIEKD